MHARAIELVDGKIRCSLQWELPLSAVRVIGESTNDHGPYLDDYFLCFAVDANGWYQASVCDQFLKSLAQDLECDLALKLAGSTDYDSNVLWPSHLAGRKMFSYKPVEPKTWIGRLFGSWSNTQWFSDDVLGELRQGRTGPCT